MKVEHDRFGIGVICKLEGKGANKKISVNFTDVGERPLGKIRKTQHSQIITIEWNTIPVYQN